MPTAVSYAHIDYTQDGVPYLVGTNTKVLQIVLDHIAYGWDAADIQRNHPYLTLAQIHSALAYYYDHQGEIEQSIEEGLRKVESIQVDLGESTVRLKLKAKGLIS